MADRVLKDVTITFGGQAYGHDAGEGYSQVTVETKDGKRFSLKPCVCAEVMRLQEIGVDVR